jgi:crossover junction endodeoxyribonuclease RusA
MRRFTVYGKPQPQGSTRAFLSGGKVNTTSANKNLKPWRQQLTDTAFAECGGIPYSGNGNEAICVTMTFYFDRPKSAKKRRMPTVKPDVDKLIRAILDSLTGICYRDDAQVVQVAALKFYGGPERVEITVQEQS